MKNSQATPALLPANRRSIDFIEAGPAAIHVCHAGAFEPSFNRPAGGISAFEFQRSATNREACGGRAVSRFGGPRLVQRGASMDMVLETGKSMRADKVDIGWEERRVRYDSQCRFPAGADQCDRASAERFRCDQWRQVSENQQQRGSNLLKLPKHRPLPGMQIWRLYFNTRPF